MAIYQYKCIVCNNEYERIQSMNSSPDKKCPICSGKVEKILFPSALHFKGNGFYITDYSKKEK